MSVTRESVMGQLLDEASDALRRKQFDTAAGLIAAFETLHRCGPGLYRPASLDSGVALEETP